ncbi:MAG TPA: GNAT family N-acetyltransferase [Candidatus Binatia bacterium]|nr:GNAT family N-acetyltransferase [Candidatus Binatia bacterium]
MPTMIRAAGPDDAEDVHRLIAALAAYERESAAVVSTPDVIRTQLADARPPFECLLAQEDGETVGFALFFATYSTWLGQQGLWLEDLFVLESHRHRGIGRALLARVAELVVARGYGRLEWSVLDWNAPALGFYRRLGAVALETWTLHRLTGDALRALAASG